jgi:hypothetical protein
MGDYTMNRNSNEPSPPRKGQPPDDVSSAPESGTVRDEISGNQFSPPDRGLPSGTAMGRVKDDPSTAMEER